MIIESFDVAGVYAEFSPGTGEIQLLDPPPPPRGSGHRGHFGTLPGLTVVLYRADGGLRLRVGDGPDVPLTEHTLVRHREVDGICTWTVTDPSATPSTVVELSYPAPAFRLEDTFDPTMTDDEDFDMGLFITRVVSDPRRRESVYL
ncbi:hypothetical protein [Streptomyces zhihengii]|uniref:hypothetical protein n=1 Tax=Streptomyces zhihengii TaxID=1818004 RepID=UPI0033B76AA4